MTDEIIKVRQEEMEKRKLDEYERKLKFD